MRKCPTCGESYADETVTFCFKDGTTLVPTHNDFRASYLTRVFPVIFILLLFGGIAFSLARCSSSSSETRTVTNTNTNIQMDRAVANARNAVETAASQVAIAANQASVGLTGKRAVVINENANLREFDNSTSEVVQTIPLGTNVEWVKQRGAWFSVRIDGKIGWMHGNTIRLLPQTTQSGYTPPSYSDGVTRRRYEECVRQRTAFGVDTSPCSEWAKER